MQDYFFALADALQAQRLTLLWSPATPGGTVNLS